MGMVSSKIRSFVGNGLLSNEQGMVAARHFDAKHFGIEVDMWLGFDDAKKVDYIKSLCRPLIEFFVLCQRQQRCPAVAAHHRVSHQRVSRVFFN
ncbi:hypothetical protein MTR_0037s0010 [Medicago truncatula]|uniref:Uncharacterized protein n=1 Tax=Medicago truncatula TaxID=3880 RepID=G7L7Q0_MEDTR|nr:hypothetical protein MTR_8g045020 [Medicago truncatula]KEH17155.1 hypothetical protein MTR_0037s0010 [Medicago truncatula]